jgi:hypothetical protein
VLAEQKGRTPKLTPQELKPVFMSHTFVALLSHFVLLVWAGWVTASRTTEIPKHRSLPPQTQHPERRMEEMDERYLNVARQIRDRLPERHWSEVVDVSRTMTMDCVNLDEIPAVALAFCRATMLSISIESGSAFIRESRAVDADPGPDRPPAAAPAGVAAAP